MMSCNFNYSCNFQGFDDVSVWAPYHLCDCKHNPLQVFKGRPPSHAYFSHKPSLCSPMVPGHPWISRKRDLSVPGTTRQLRDLAVIGDLRKCGRTFSYSPAAVKPRPQPKGVLKVSAPVKLSGGGVPRSLAWTKLSGEWDSRSSVPINPSGAHSVAFSTITSAIAFMRGLLMAHFL